MITEINPTRFVKALVPLLAVNDVTGLQSVLKRRFCIEQIIELLHCEQSDARKLAIISLGLVGNSCCCGQVANQLQDPDPVVIAMAEHSLWTIWFRGGNNNRANRHLASAVAAMDRQDLGAAVHHCDEAIRLDADLSEAFHQRALAHCLMEKFKEAVRDCRQATGRMPCHFSAWSTMGHCYLHQGKIASATKCYQQAIEIHPGLTEIRQAVLALTKTAPVPVA